jgi:hypothetical protein
METAATTQAGSPPTPPRTALHTSWRNHTNAEIVTEARFMQLKQHSRWRVVGVAGFARPWSQLELQGASLAQLVADARATICHELVERQRRYAHQLIVASGATNQGVLQLAYEVCEFLNIVAMGVAPDQVSNYPLGRMRFMLPFGARFGDESHVFLRTVDELIVLGGGAQSQREVLAAAQTRMPITIIQGFGGIADQLTRAELPAARFVRRIATGRC